MEPCPSCGNEGTYRHHSDLGYTTCNGCDDKICSECAHGARYFCAYFQSQLRDQCPPPPPAPRLERQITEGKWEDAEAYMNAHPECQVFEVAKLGIHLYLMVRTKKGRLLRIHATDEIS